MPDLDGISAIRQIKRALPETEVVVYSAHSSEEVIEEAFEAGAKSYIGKAGTSRDLIDAIRSVTGSFRSFETVTWSGAVSPAAARTSTAVS